MISSEFFFSPCVIMCVCTYVGLALILHMAVGLYVIYLYHAEVAGDVFAYVTCTCESYVCRCVCLCSYGTAHQPVEISPSVSIVCVFSCVCPICLLHISVYVTGNLPKQLVCKCVCMCIWM